MRTVAACAAALIALLIAAPASAEISEAQSSWQLRKVSTSGFLSRLTARPLPNGGLLARATAKSARPAAPVSSAILSEYEYDIVRRMNAIRAARGLRALRVSRELSAAAAYHTNQMGLRGFFEHESANGTEFWKRIERFYPSRHASSWAVGENLLWGSPEISVAEAVRAWMNSPAHRANILSREWRDVGLGAAHFDSAPGEFRGGPVTIMTTDFGARN